MILFLFLFICVLNCESITFHIETDSTNNDGHDFINDQSLMNWIDAGYEDTCPKLRKEVMDRREIGDKMVFFVFGNEKKASAGYFRTCGGSLIQNTMRCINSVDL